MIVKNYMIFQKNKITIIEDAAHSFGGKYDCGSIIGSCKYSDMTVFISSCKINHYFRRWSDYNKFKKILRKIMCFKKSWNAKKKISPPMVL